MAELALAARCARSAAKRAGAHGGGSNLSRYAADGHSVVDPYSGMMAGMCVAAKNKDATSRAMLGLVGRPTTKKRWFILDGKTLKWFYEDMATRASSEASVTAEEIISVTADYNPPPTGVSATTMYGLEIIARSRRVQLWCEREDEQMSWLMALRAARDGSIDSKYVDRLNVAPLTDDGRRECMDNFKKHSEFYLAVAEGDREKVIKRALTGIDQTNIESVSGLIIKHAHVSGRSRELLALLHHLLHFPAEDKNCWSLLLRQVQLIRDDKLDIEAPPASPPKRAEDSKKALETKIRDELESQMESRLKVAKEAAETKIREELEREMESKIREAIETEQARGRKVESGGSVEASKELEGRVLELEQENEALQAALDAASSSE